MQPGTLEALQTWNIGPFPFIQSANSGNEDVANVLDNLASVCLFEFDMPLAGKFVPSSLNGLVLEVHIFAQPIFLYYAQPVF